MLALTGRKKSFPTHEGRGSASCLCTNMERTFMFTNVDDTMEAALQGTEGKRLPVQKKQQG